MKASIAVQRCARDGNETEDEDGCCTVLEFR
jgi:hypothetical protein